MCMTCPRSSALILLWAALFAMALGCARSDSTPKPRPRFLEDLFSRIGVAVERRRKDALFSLKEGIDAEYAACEIEAYLRKQPGARQARDIPGAYAERVSLTERDFWAMVLAELRGFDLEALRQERPGEDVVEAMLREIARAPEKYPARRDLSFSPVAAALKKRMCETKLMFARYLGLAADEIVELVPRYASPRNLETAQNAGLKKEFIVSSRPTSLPERAYPWEGVVDFRLRSQPDEPYMGCCYFDPKMDRWLADEVKRGEPLLEMPKRVEPVQGWNPLEFK